MSEIFVLLITGNLRMYISVVSSAIIFISGFMKICRVGVDLFRWRQSHGHNPVFSHQIINFV